MACSSSKGWAKAEGDVPVTHGYSLEPKKEVGQFLGVDGATSLKAEIVGRIPKINDASTFREARKLLQQLGGAVALRDELAFAGFVEAEGGNLSTMDKPFNVFARFAAGKMVQSSLFDEQKALVEFNKKFLICANRPDNDLYWDSKEPYWISKASMARRHRFLTTLDLHWQWFNMLIVGLVPPEHGGVDLDVAVREVEQMRAAALQFAKKAGGWSDQIGLYVNIFGHNNVNSLFVHILDMSQVGPGFGFQTFKNCPLDDVLKVLREEAGGDKIPMVIRSLMPVKQAGDMRKRRTGEVNFFFAGTDGATSLKAELVGRVPVLKDAAAFREARRLLVEELGGAWTVKEELYRCGFLDVESGLLTTGTNPFNVFARVATSVMTQKGMEVEQRALGEYQENFMICCNRPENDEHWDSEEAEWIGKASMSRRHRFLTTKNTHWQWFNALVFGLVPHEDNGVSLQEALEQCYRMKAAALKYAANVGGWSEKVGLYFHVFGHNSINSLHMHILDLSYVGPTFYKMEYKNCPVDAVIKVLKEEIANGELAKTTAPPGTGAAPTTLQEEADEAAKQAAHIRHSLNQSRRSILSYSAGENAELLHLNVGGDVVIVPRETLLLAPKESLLHSTFRTDWDGPKLVTDGDGRIFLNYPARSFKCIVDHLRLLHLTPSNQVLEPPEVDKSHHQEFRDLAWLLGVDDFLFAGPRAGVAKERQLRAPWMPRVQKVVLPIADDGGAESSTTQEPSESLHH